MNREDIISKMREAGLKTPARGDFIFIHWDQIAMLLDHERAAEREACAELMERQHTWISNVAASAAIRARGQE